DGRLIQYAYNALNLLLREDWLASGAVIPSITKDYDILGRVITMQDGSVVERYTYTNDTTDRPLSESQALIPGLDPIQLSIGTTNPSVLTSVVVSVGNTPPLLVNTYGYDPVNDRLTSISQTGSFVSPKRVNFTYADNLYKIGKVDQFSDASGSNLVLS